MSYVRLWFVAGASGSTSVFQKVLNVACHDERTLKRPDFVLLAGDLCGIEPATNHDSDNGSHIIQFRGERIELHDAADSEAYIEQLEQVFGAYVHRNAPDNCLVTEANQLARLGGWAVRADRLRDTDEHARMLVVPGPTDPDCSVPLLGSCLEVCDEQVIALPDGLTVVSVGKTVWNVADRSPRPPRMYDTEDALEARLRELLSQVADPRKSILILYSPPAESYAALRKGLDAHGLPVTTSLTYESESNGSSAVSRIIRDFEPMLTLHCAASMQSHETVGKTLVLNPGSEASEGLVRGVWLELDDGRLAKWGFTREDLKQDSIDRIFAASEDAGQAWFGKFINMIKAFVDTAKKK